jgi:hypothetical protein
MTNDERMTKSEARKPARGIFNGRSFLAEAIRISGFGFLSSFVIRHSTFLVPGAPGENLGTDSVLP